jgi:hypothetical protein
MADEPIPSIAVLPPAPPKRIHGNKGHKPTEKQMEGLKKGMEALKQKREAIKVKKAEKKEKQKAGIPIDDSSEDEAPPKKEAEAERPKPIIQYIPVKAKPPRKDAGLPRPPKNYVMRDDFEAFKTSILDTIKTTGVIKEVSVPVDRIVEKETIKEVPVHTTKVLTGSDMLNKIFGFN